MERNGGFLAGRMERAWKLSGKHKLRTEGLFVGNGANAVEVAVARADTAPPRAVLLTASLSANMTETPASFGITVGRWR